MASFIETLQDYTSVISQTRKTPAISKDAVNSIIHIQLSSNKFYLIRITDVDGYMGTVALVTITDKGVSYDIHTNVDLSYYIKIACSSGRVTIEDGSTLASQIASEIQMALAGKIK